MLFAKNDVSSHFLIYNIFNHLNFYERRKYTKGYKVVV